jgi:hypothetical protein
MRVLMRARPWVGTTASAQPPRHPTQLFVLLASKTPVWKKNWINSNFWVQRKRTPPILLPHSLPQTPIWNRSSRPRRKWCPSCREPKQEESEIKFNGATTQLIKWDKDGVLLPKSLPLITIPLSRNPKSCELLLWDRTYLREPATLLQETHSSGWKVTPSRKPMITLLKFINSQLSQPTSKDNTVPAPLILEMLTQHAIKKTIPLSIFLMQIWFNHNSSHLFIPNTQAVITT